MPNQDLDPKLLEQLAGITQKSWSGRVYRYMLMGSEPDRENNRGARWNPPGVPAIYTSLTEQGAIAEVEYRLSLESIPPRRGLRKTLYEIDVTLGRVLIIPDFSALQKFDVSELDMKGFEYKTCQKVGGHVDWLEMDGLMVPSARHEGANLVIYRNNCEDNYRFEVLSRRDL